MSDPYPDLARRGVEALHRGDAAAARAAFEQVDAAGRGTAQLRLLLAQACATLDDVPAATTALDRVIADEPGNLPAIVLRGDLLLRAGDDRAAVSWYQAALAHAPRAGQLPPDLVRSLRRIERIVADRNAAFGRHVADALAGIDVAAAGRRFGESLDLLAGRAEVQLQQPTSFYYPQLPQRPFYERDEFAWVPALEAAAPAIRAELSAVLHDGAGLRPYVAGERDRPVKAHPLLEDARWSAFHLFERGLPLAANADRCPHTMAALAAVPMPLIAGRSPMALFSVLKPRTHIPPHHGMLNTRLICHLPLIVPHDCRLRVGNETRSVHAGETMLFDDSFEHEAWNDSDETRVVLIFEVWKPELSPAERAALTTLFAAIGDYTPG